jgi:hypothetical protein
VAYLSSGRSGDGPDRGHRGSSRRTRRPRPRRTLETPIRSTRSRGNRKQKKPLSRSCLPGPGQLRAGASFPVLPAQPQRNRPNLVPVMVETRRSHQPARSTMAGLGISPPRRLNRHEHLVARRRRPPHGSPALRGRPFKGCNPFPGATQQTSSKPSRVTLPPPGSFKHNQFSRG